MSMNHKRWSLRTVRIADDAADPVLKMLDCDEVSMQEIFDALGWDPIPAELFKNQVQEC